MHAGQNTKMLRGAIWAFALPASLGLSAFLFFQIEPILAHLSLFSVFAIYFILGSALSAWLATRRLKRIERLEKLKRWRTSFIAGLTAGSLIHLVSTFLLIAFQLVTIYSLKNSDDGFGLNYNAVYNSERVLSILANLSSASLYFWFIVTLPLSLICATIFWRVTKFQENPDP